MRTLIFHFVLTLPFFALHSAPPPPVPAFFVHCYRWFISNLAIYQNENLPKIICIDHFACTELKSRIKIKQQTLKISRLALAAVCVRAVPAQIAKYERINDEYKLDDHQIFAYRVAKL